MTFSEQELYAQARILRSDERENPEYDRALVELIAYLTLEDISSVATKLFDKLGDEVDVPEELT